MKRVQVSTTTTTTQTKEEVEQSELLPNLTELSTVLPTLFNSEDVDEILPKLTAVKLKTVVSLTSFFSRYSTFEDAFKKLESYGLHENDARSLFAFAQKQLTLREAPKRVKTQHVPMSVENFDRILKSLPFKQNFLLADDESHRKVLGDLYNPSFKWPITKRGAVERVDMRLFNRSEISNDTLRPGAQELISKINVADQGGHFGLLASPGSGKTSDMFDMAREHYAILMTLSVQNEFFDQNKLRRMSIHDYDQGFDKFYRDVRASIELDPLKEEERFNNYDIAARRAKIELICRVAQLYRLDLETFQRESRNVTPEEFLLHQVAGNQSFLLDLVDKLQKVEEESLTPILEYLRENLAHLFANQKRLVLCLDEVEVGMHLFGSCFRRRGDDVFGEGTTKGIIAPLTYAAKMIKVYLHWSIVWAGTGASHEATQSLMPSLGKTKDDLTTIQDPSMFPSCTPDDVRNMLSRLKLSEDILMELQSTAFKSFTIWKPLPEEALSCIELLKYYVIGGRFCLLSNIIENIREFTTSSTLDEAEKLREAIKKCVGEHRKGLVNMIQKRVFSRDKYWNNFSDENRNQFKILLRRIYFATQVFGEGIGYGNVIFDLRSLGIAVAIQVRHGDSPMFKVSERFVLESIQEIFSDPDIFESVADAQFLSSKELGILNEFGKRASFKGNVFEQMILDRFVSLSQNIPVSNLPFFPHTQLNNTSWNNIIFRANRVCLSDDLDEELSSFLKGEKSIGVVVSPEHFCGPDGILMLDHSHAITVGSAVYSNYVKSSKVVSQFASTDMSRAFLSKTGRIYPAVKNKRERWCANELHLIKAVRIHFSFPCAQTTEHIQLFRELKVEGGSKIPIKEPQHYDVEEERIIEWNTRLDEFEATDDEHDVIVNIDQTNLSLFFGEKTSDMIKLLKLATGVTTGWEHETNEGNSSDN